MLKGAPSVPKADFEAYVRSVYGPDVIIPEEIIDSRILDFFIYDGETDTYLYGSHEAHLTGDPFFNSIYRRKIIKVEEKDGFLFIYDIFGNYIQGDSYDYKITGSYILLTRNLETDPILVGTEGKDFQTNPNSTYLRYLNGELDDLLPVYKHTFRQHEDGSYYWYSSEYVPTENPATSDLNCLNFALAFSSALLIAFMKLSDSRFNRYVNKKNHRDT